MKVLEQHSYSFVFAINDQIVRFVICDCYFFFLGLYCSLSFCLFFWDFLFRLLFRKWNTYSIRLRSSDCFVQSKAFHFSTEVLFCVGSVFWVIILLHDEVALWRPVRCLVVSTPVVVLSKYYVYTTDLIDFLYFSYLLKNVFISFP